MAITRSSKVAREAAGSEKGTSSEVIEIVDEIVQEKSHDDESNGEEVEDEEGEDEDGSEENVEVDEEDGESIEEEGEDVQGEEGEQTVEAEKVVEGENVVEGQDDDNAGEEDEDDKVGEDDEDDKEGEEDEDNEEGEDDEEGGADEEGGQREETVEGEKDENDKVEITRKGKSVVVVAEPIEEGYTDDDDADYEAEEEAEDDDEDSDDDELEEESEVGRKKGAKADKQKGKKGVHASQKKKSDGDEEERKQLAICKSRCGMERFFTTFRAMNLDKNLRLKEEITRTPFGYLLDCPKRKSDQALLSALVTCWDKKLQGCRISGSFLPFTVDDVAQIVGLPNAGLDVVLPKDSKADEDIGEEGGTTRGLFDVMFGNSQGGRKQVEDFLRNVSTVDVETGLKA